MAHPRAGQPAQPEDLVDIAALLAAYEGIHPDLETRFRRWSSARPAIAARASTRVQRGSHRGRSPGRLRIPRREGTTGPLLVGRDTHGLSEPAWRTVLEVLAGNDVQVLVDTETARPRPPLSRTRSSGSTAVPEVRAADGIVITPSHNPPRDGGIKYNPPHGGPADSDATGWIATARTSCSRAAKDKVKRRRRAGARRRHLRLPRPLRRRSAVRASTWTRSGRPASGSAPTRWAAHRSTTGPRSANRRARPDRGEPGVDPSGVHDARHDGKIRMDCSSPNAMASPWSQAEGPVRGRDRQRRRLRPARHRHPRRRA